MSKYESLKPLIENKEEEEDEDEDENKDIANIENLPKRKGKRKDSVLTPLPLLRKKTFGEVLDIQSKDVIKEKC